MRNSRFSWAFHETGNDIYGSKVTPLTAHESFVVQRSDHSGVVNVFADLLSLGPRNPVGSQFLLSRLLYSKRNSLWDRDRYDDDGDPSSDGLYEAVITAKQRGKRVSSLSYVRGNREQSLDA